jgi:outer membrane protein, protease secretion system
MKPGSRMKQGASGCCCWIGLLAGAAIICSGTTWAQPAEASDAVSAPGGVLTLEEVVQRAERADPGLQAAQYAAAAGEEFRNIGRGAMLPLVRATGNVGRNQQDRKVPSGLQRIEDTRYYDSTNVGVRLTQPLLSFDDLGSYRDGMARADAAAATFFDATQVFRARVIGRYIDVLAANRELELLEAEGADLERQNEVAAARFERGDGTRLELAEVDTAFKRWRVDVLAARSAARRAVRALEASAGALAPGEPQQLVDRDADESRIVVGTPEGWLRVAGGANPSLAQAQADVDIRRAAVTRAKSYHYPRVDGFISHTLNDSDTVNTVNQRFETSTVGVQVSLPLFSGGAGAAYRRQAEAQLKQAESALDATEAELALQVAEAYDDAQLAREQIVALEAAEAAALEALEAARMAYRAGAESVSEVLTAQRQYRVVQRDRVRARYLLISAFVDLHAVGGLLDPIAVGRLSALLAEGAAIAPPGSAMPAANNAR